MKHAPIRPPRAAVHIVDDDATMRRALWYMLEAAGYAPRVFGAGQDYLDELDFLPVAPMIADLWMPDLDGLTLLEETKRRRPVTPVVLMTAAGDVASAVRAMKAGAFDFVQKPIDQETLVDIAAAAVAQVVDDTQRDHLAIDAIRRIDSLSLREREVLSCLAAGKSNKVIAFELGLSIRTVEMHRVRMMRRLGVRGLPEALRVAHLAGLDALPCPAS